MPEQEADRKLYFILALHNHQPVGNLPEAFEKNFEGAYAPFLEVISRYPDIKFTMHNSGILLEWLRNNQPAYLDLLRSMVEKGQVEIMGGGFYEPIMPVIRDEDKLGQINKLTRWVEEELNTTPRGMWLPERIWEPALARPIAQAGLNYITVDDTHFREVGIDELAHYYITEEEGWKLNIFPISEELRYLIPFRPPLVALDYLRSFYTEKENRVLVLADDGEKFGGWPHTYRAVYEEGWLEDFLELLSASTDWLQTVTFSEYMQISPPRGLAYLPASSYREMKEWSQGFWRNFLVRYPESNRMHKKMLAVRQRIDQMDKTRNGEEAKYEALQHLWAGQCNCAYWHGVFGGLYLNFLRAGIWENLVRAEEVAERTLHHGLPFLEIRREDRDYDGQEEVVVITDRFSMLFAPHWGGSMWEFSWRPGAVNFLDTLTRREESYHREIAEKILENTEAGENEGKINGSRENEGGVKSIHEIDIGSMSTLELKNYLRYDSYPRGGLVEHFFPVSVDFETFAGGDIPEGVCLIGPAQVELQYSGGLPGNSSYDSPARGIILFSREIETEEATFTLSKKVSLARESDRIAIEYNIVNQGERELNGWFGSEFNLSLLGGNDQKRYYHIPGRNLQESTLASRGEEIEVKEVALYDEWRGFKLSFTFSDPSLFWRFPIETVSRSEGGLEKTYQHSLVMPLWHLQLSPGDSWKVNLEVEVEKYCP